jgi:hypothetical protein
MRQVTYEIKNISMVSKTTKTGKPYSVAHVEYRDDQGKLQERDIMPFGVQSKVNNFLSGAQPGVYTVTLVKNDQGFNDWTDIKQGAGTPMATTQGTTGASPSPRSTYETPEERALRQKYIVRQSSITNAISLFELDKKRVPTVQDIIHVAKEFENYVFGNVVKEDPTGLTELEDDVPL